MKRFDVWRWGLFALLSVPTLSWLRGIWMGDLGIDPIETLTDESGEWALRILLLSLAISPLRQWLKRPQLIRFRRQIGLWAYWYASIHLTVYLWLDRGLEFDTIVNDIIDRPFITAGFLGFILLTPLAITSNKASIRRLKKRWMTLHMLVYPATLAVILHLWWLTRADFAEPTAYAIIFAGLIAWRLRRWRSRSGKDQLAAQQRQAIRST